MKRKRRRWPWVLLTIFLVIVVGAAGMYFYVDSSLKRIVALTDYAGRPADSPGANWLIVGTDSRDGLSEEEKDELATGSVKGSRTDSMLLLHIPEGDARPTLVSLLRDSLVTIPGKGKNKLNAAYAFGGPQLLAKTVETNTGIHLDHYIEIGFGGFAGVVDAIGGVNICVETRMVDPKAGLDLQPGCQDLTGPQALGYVRTRATPRADLDRVLHQRKFLSALVDKVTSPGVLLNPFKLFPLISDLPDAVTINDGDHVPSLLSLAFAMRGGEGTGPVTTTVPFSGSKSLPGVGSAIVWDDTKSKALFDALRNDTPVPPNAISAN